MDTEIQTLLTTALLEEENARRKQQCSCPWLPPARGTCRGARSKSWGCCTVVRPQRPVPARRWSPFGSSSATLLKIWNDRSVHQRPLHLGFEHRIYLTWCRVRDFARWLFVPKRSSCVLGWLQLVNCIFCHILRWLLWFCCLHQQQKKWLTWFWMTTSVCYYLFFMK